MTFIAKIKIINAYGFGFQFDDLLSNNDNLKIKAAHFNTRTKDYIDADVAIFQGYTQSTNIIVDFIVDYH